MSYKNAVNNILNYKKQWEDATNAGNTTKAKSASENAKGYYQSLRDNGYGQLADNLSSKNYSDAEKYVKDYLGTVGKTAIRPYFYNKGAQYGLSQADIDKNLSYNTTTGEVSYAGLNLGKPAYEADGVSYWDESTLANAWDKIVSNSGYNLSDEQVYKNKRDETMNQQSETFDIIKQNAENYNQQNAEFVDMARNDDPLDTEWGKSIMNYYNWQGGKAANDATASSAATNSGNVDSFAAANAARQQLAYTNSGIAAVTNQFSDRLSAVQAALEGLSDNNYQMESSLRDTISQGMQQSQQAFDNDQTAKNNAQARKNSETERLSLVADVTGYIPDEFLKEDNPLFNKETGELLNPDMDIEATVIQPALKILNNPNASQAQKAAAQRMYNYGQQAKIYKTQNYSQYKQYANTVGGYMPEETAAMRDATAQRELEKLQSALGLLATEAEAESAAEAALQEALMKQYEIDTKAATEKYKIDVENGIITGGDASVDDEAFNQAIERLKKDLSVGVKIDSNGKVDPTDLALVSNIINALEKDTNLSEEERYGILARMGIDNDALEAVSLSPYR